MPKRLPDKTKLQERKPKRFNRKGRWSQASQQYTPVREEQELKVVIDDVGSLENGISGIQSLLAFVSRAKVGERIRVKTARVNRDFALAEENKEMEGEN